MKIQSTYDDVNLILRLYELRREARMREARTWYMRNFKAKTWEELNQLCPLGSEQNASFRMVISYWEMVASFIVEGVLNQDLFFQSGRELLFVWERVKELAPKVRDLNKDPSLLRNMETVANAYIEWLNQQSPEAYAAYKARVHGM